MKVFSKLIKNGKSTAFLSVVLVALIALLLYFIYGRRGSETMTAKAIVRKNPRNFIPTEGRFGPTLPPRQYVRPQSQFSGTRYPNNLRARVQNVKNSRFTRKVSSNKQDRWRDQVNYPGRFTNVNTINPVQIPQTSGEKIYSNFNSRVAATRANNPMLGFSSQPPPSFYKQNQKIYRDMGNRIVQNRREINWPNVNFGSRTTNF